MNNEMITFCIILLGVSIELIIARRIIKRNLRKFLKELYKTQRTHPEKEQ